eukprot:CAMPEP_0174702796 /NCGR_PEP_ID=MMETSP1094-20130205/6958_1 /TAXON_ID=156173 /ORGANISM="Chrysochromulina brevifilum, Strain UTEX LB 985" /LENGTH=36 /DNA_ID= /DNA_START= /DNA_END= /DNA_ORIENTATION=
MNHTTRAREKKCSMPMQRKRLLQNKATDAVMLKVRW